MALLSHPWITLNPTVEVSNWGLRAKRISDKMAKRAVSCTWASTVEGVLMGAVFRGRSTLQAEFLNPWASQLEQSYCALQGLLDLNHKHPKSMKFLLDSGVSCVCWSRLLYHSEKEDAYTMHIVIVLLISWDFHLNRKIISITLGGSKSLTNRGKEFVLRESHWPGGFKIHSPRHVTMTSPLAALNLH